MMIIPFVNIHTHARTDCGVELVSVMAGRDARRTARQAVEAGLAEAADLAGTASVELDLPSPPFSIGVHPWEVGGASDLSAALAEVEQAAALAGTASVELDLPAPPFSIGVHPWEVGGASDLSAALTEVEQAAADGTSGTNGTGCGCAAIGEIGLDAAIREAREEANMDAQRAVFAAQLAIAQRHALPVVLHCVRAFEPVMEMLAKYRLPAVIFHGFTGSPEQAARAVAAGYRLSFGPRSLSSPRTVEALRTVPLDRVFLETDAERTTIAEVYSHAAALLDIPVERLAGRLYDNYITIFGK